MNDQAELMALRIIEELEGAGAVDVNKISDVLWSRLSSLTGGEPMTLEDSTRDWRRFHAVP
jgi:hypothetical protein